MNNTDDEMIAVFDRKLVFSIIEKIGFSEQSLPIDKLQKITKEVKRADAEIDLSLVQLVSVFIIKEKNEILLFKKTKKSPEKRLHHKYSMIFGAHILCQKTLNINFEKNADIDIFIRELNEELYFDKSPKIDYKGLIYINTNEVSKQHLGIVFFVESEKKYVNLAEENQFFKTKFMSIREIRSNIKNLDEWSANLHRVIGENGLIKYSAVLEGVVASFTYTIGSR